MQVGELLSGSRTYKMPIFQRPYAWTAEEAGQLLDDLHNSMHAGDEASPENANYFLGQLIVSQAHPNAPYEVIDGQQRLVTLSALLAVLRDLLPPSDFRNHLHDHLVRPENAARVLPRSVRIMLRDLDTDEYNRWIADRDGTHLSPPTGDTDATERLAQVIARLKEDIGTPQPRYLTALASHILNRCYVVLVITSSSLDGYQLFRSINARGQPLTDIDLVRGEIISRYHDTKLATAWSQIEDQIGIDQLSTYVKSIMTLVHPATQGMSLRAGVLNILSHPSKALIFTDTLKKFIEIYGELENGELNVANGNTELARTIACVQALPFDDWLPAALLWLAQSPSQRATLEFFRALDALGLGLLVLGSTTNTISTRMRKVVEHIVSGDCLDSPNSPLFLTSAEREKILARIESPIATRSRFIRPLLLRLNAALLDNTIPPYFPKQVTLEHVLPQKPATRSLWKEKFPDQKKREELSQMLGNFAILSTKVNPKASNFDFLKKREIIFGGNDSNVFPLTAQLIKYNDWTAAEIMDRQVQLCSLARKILRI